MPYKSKLKERLYSKDNLYSNYRASFKKDNSSSALDKKNDSKKQFQKFEKKTYFSYKSNLKSDNPFKGPSKFEKSIKERKDHISKTVEKEENEFYDIAIIEEKISVKKELNNEELNQLINKFNEMMYKEYSDNKEELKGYEYKINKISNIMKMMDSDEQIKILDELEKNADSDYKNEMFEKLKNKIDEYNRNKNIIFNKKDNQDEEDEDYLLNVKSKNKKSVKKWNK